jgi:hypothetical protein
MTKLLKWMVIVLVCLVNNASAASNSTVLDPNAKPVQDLSIIVGMGEPPHTAYFSPETRAWYSSQLKEAFSRRLPEIFSANGIPVRAINVTSTLDFDEPWGDAPVDGGPSHYLVLNAYEFSGDGTGQSVVFEATLWSAREQKKVWKTYSSLGVIVKQPLLRTQEMAARLMEKLRDDRMLTLPNKIPVDLAGEPIKAYWIFAKDR